KGENVIAALSRRFLYRVIFRRLAHDHMGVGPTEAERAHAGKARAAVAFPLDRFEGELYVESLALDVRVPLLEIEVTRDLLVLEREDRLDDAGHAGDWLHVSDVGLDASQRERSFLAARRSKHIAQRVELDRVAECSAGSVGFDEVDVLRLDR